MGARPRSGSRLRPHRTPTAPHSPSGRPGPVELDLHLTPWNWAKCSRAFSAPGPHRRRTPPACSCPQWGRPRPERRTGAGDCLAVVDGQRPLLINIEAEIPLPRLLHIFHIPQGAARRLHEGLGKLGRHLGHLPCQKPPTAMGTPLADGGQAHLVNQKERSRNPTLANTTIILNLIYHSPVPIARGWKIIFPFRTNVEGGTAALHRQFSLRKAGFGRYPALFPPPGGILPASRPR